MSEFKGILLNRERIDDCINGYFGENVKINKQIQQKKVFFHYYNLY